MHLEIFTRVIHYIELITTYLLTMSMKRKSLLSYKVIVFMAFFTNALTLSCSSMFLSLCFRFISFHKVAPLYVIESFKVFVLKRGADSLFLARRE